MTPLLLTSPPTVPVPPSRPPIASETRPVPVPLPVALVTNIDPDDIVVPPEYVFGCVNRSVPEPDLTSPSEPATTELTVAVTPESTETAVPPSVSVDPVTV